MSAVPKEVVSAWLREWFAARGTPPVRPTDDIFASGGVDSLALLELIVAIESRFGIRLEERHLADERFQTPDGLAELVGEVARGAG